MCKNKWLIITIIIKYNRKVKKKVNNKQYCNKVAKIIKWNLVK